YPCPRRLGPDLWRDLADAGRSRAVSSERGDAGPYDERRPCGVVVRNARHRDARGGARAAGRLSRAGSPPADRLLRRPRHAGTPGPDIAALDPGAAAEGRESGDD